MDNPDKLTFSQRALRLGNKADLLRVALETIAEDTQLEPGHIGYGYAEAAEEIRDSLLELCDELNEITAPKTLRLAVRKAVQS